MAGLTQAPPGGADALPVWPVGALCRAVGDTLAARFNPVQVRGEISGFSQAASGHCYFSLKDAQGQIRCAMFRRAAQALTTLPREGDQVEVQGRLGVYEARGDLQLVVEVLRRAGQGALYEQFLQRKARLQALGLFDASRKRALPRMPRGVGVVTSLGAAALHDVAVALQRRAPYLPVVIAPAAVQGAQAPAELLQALQALYTLALDPQAPVRVDVILLVRGGGSIEDLWAFNDEALAHGLAQSPVPVVSGVGHDTDFTIADFVADLRAPTPTAAAELCAPPAQLWLEGLQAAAARLQRQAQYQVDNAAQHLDRLQARLGRPSALSARQQARLADRAQRLRHALQAQRQRSQQQLQALAQRLPQTVGQTLQRHQGALLLAQQRLHAVDPQRVLARGYALLTDAAGQPVTHVASLSPGQPVSASLADGEVDLQVLRSIPR